MTIDEITKEELVAYQKSLNYETYLSKKKKYFWKEIPIFTTFSLSCQGGLVAFVLGNPLCLPLLAVGGLSLYMYSKMNNRFYEVKKKLGILDDN
ncbi:MAG: hypothetical protein ABIC91_08365 [Nanoarchaeota archaeon]|nr:hypothetical protein [Nanoarchaeota archaeon]MBU1030349.1 hypothetical protein [Nanoarchaeota archaeon]MBU1849809.1 hypothetical protein [Nanoarchaeota archaeon]